MPSRKLTPGGNRPPSCKYLCTASRPVKTTPLRATSSRTFNARIFSSVKGKERLIIFSLGKFPGLAADFQRGLSVQPSGDFPLRIQRHAQPPIGPAHVTDADEKRRGQTIDRAN